MPELALAVLSTFAQAEEAAPVSAVVITAARPPQAAADVLSDHVLLSSEDIARSGWNGEGKFPTGLPMVERGPVFALRASPGEPSR